MAERAAIAEHYFCPECGRYVAGPNDVCSGGKARVSFLDAKHSANVRPERDGMGEGHTSPTHDAPVAPEKTSDMQGES